MRHIFRRSCQRRERNLEAWKIHSVLRGIELIFMKLPIKGVVNTVCIRKLQFNYQLRSFSPIVGGDDELLHLKTASLFTNSRMVSSNICIPFSFIIQYFIPPKNPQRAVIDGLNVTISYFFRSKVSGNSPKMGNQVEKVLCLYIFSVESAD